MKKKYFIVAAMMIFAASLMLNQGHLGKTASYNVEKKITPLHRSLNTDQIVIAIYEEDDFIVKLGFSTSEQVVVVNETSMMITLETQNTKGLPAVVSEDTVIDLSSTSIGGSFSLTDVPWAEITQVTILNGQSSVDFYYKDSAIGSFVLSAAEVVDQRWTDATQDITIAPDVDTFKVETNSDVIVAGEDFTVTVTALDSNAAIIESFTGTVDLTTNYISPDTGTNDLTTSTVTLASGIGSVINQTYVDCGTITITATNQADTGHTGTSSEMTLVPQDFTVTIDQVEFAASSLGLRHIVNKEFPIDIVARNKGGNTCGNYYGPATLSYENVEPGIDQGAAVTPADLTADLWDSGTLNLTNAMYDQWGSVTFTVTDDTLLTSQGTSEVVMFLPKTFTYYFAPPPESRSFYYINEPFDVSVTAVDENDNAVSNYAGTVAVFAEGFNFPSEYSFTGGEGGIHVFGDISSSSAINDAIIVVNDSVHKEIIANASPITVKDAALKVYSNSGPIGDLSILIAVVDVDGNIIEEDNSTIVMVELKEAIKDDSASSSATKQFVTLSQGKANIIVHDEQGEVVEITPRSMPVLNAIKGQATFGTVARKGLGIQMYREVK